MAEWFAHAALPRKPGASPAGAGRHAGAQRHPSEGGFEADPPVRGQGPAPAGGVRGGPRAAQRRARGQGHPAFARAGRPIRRIRPARPSTGCPRASPATTTRARRPRSTRRFSSTGNGCTACARCSAAMPPAWWPRSWGRRNLLTGSPPPCGTRGCATRSCSTPPSRWRACGVTSSTATSRCPVTPSPTGSSAAPASRPQGVVVALEVTDATAKRMRGDFTFLDGRGEVVARLTGYEAVYGPPAEPGLQTGRPAGGVKPAVGRHDLAAAWSASTRPFFPTERTTMNGCRRTRSVTMCVSGRTPKPCSPCSARCANPTGSKPGNARWCTRSPAAPSSTAFSKPPSRATAPRTSG